MSTRFEPMCAIIRFLGYDPFPEPTNRSERLLAKRRAMGWSIKEAARQRGVDEGTWRAWERGTILFRRHRALLARLLGPAAEEIHTEMALRWNLSHLRVLILKWHQAVYERLADLTDVHLDSTSPWHHDA